MFYGDFTAIVRYFGISLFVELILVFFVGTVQHRQSCLNWFDNVFIDRFFVKYLEGYDCCFDNW